MGVCSRNGVPQINISTAPATGIEVTWGTQTVVAVWHGPTAEQFDGNHSHPYRRYSNHKPTHFPNTLPRPGTRVLTETYEQHQETTLFPSVSTHPAAKAKVTRHRTLQSQPLSQTLPRYQLISNALARSPGFPRPVRSPI